MKYVRHEANECHIPRYMQDVLTNNYCPNFLRMSMVREQDDYIFKYQTDRYTKLDIEKLDTYRKLILLRSIIQLHDKNEDWLIQSENYMLDPELVYCIDNNVGENDIRLLFYPDKDRGKFTNKIIRFAEKIMDLHDKQEVDIVCQFGNFAKSEDWNRARLFLDKNILRMETRTQLVV